ncbi:MAG TPA: HD-GYP domain-containing protein [Fimbriimonas sp.]|nr:HD-GYP domain-containing protein [Fimbriimonas sp.]
MSKMPLAAKIYWLVVLVLGAGAAVLSQILVLPTSVHHPVEGVIFAGLALLFGGQKVVVKKLKDDDDAMSMTLGFAITFAAMLRLGPVSTVPISMLACVSSCIYPRKQPGYQLFFNVALSALEALAGGLVFVYLNGWTLELEPARTFVAVAGSCVSFFLLNTIGVSAMICFITKDPIVTIWKENFSWTLPSYLASACVGALAMLLFHGSSAAIVLFVLPIAYFVYRSLGNSIARAAEKQKHIEELQIKQQELAELYLSTIKSLALAVDAKDRYTHQHIIRVQRYAVAIAEEMGLEGDELQGVRTGALLHDIGKLGIPEQVLLKPGALTDEEFHMIRQHPEMGAAILGPVKFPWPVLPSVKHHHERMDGSGYPDGLKGDEIHLTARIMAVADVYDAITSTRSYREARTHAEALTIIREGADRLFDREVVDAFSRVIDRVVLEMAKEGTGPLAPRVVDPLPGDIAEYPVKVPA